MHDENLTTELPTMKLPPVPQRCEPEDDVRKALCAALTITERSLRIAGWALAVAALGVLAATIANLS